MNGCRAVRPAYPTAGSDHSVQDLLVEYRKVTYRVALRLTRSVEDAEDLVQEALLRAWRSRHTFRPGTNGKAWLLRILHHANIDRFRAARRQVPVLLELHEEARAFTAYDTPESEVLAGVIEPQVLAALHDLPERFRTCVVLADLEGCSYAEIAHRLRIRPGTVMSRVFRGRRQLRRRLRASASAA